jgi:hypothetical protein
MTRRFSRWPAWIVLASIVSQQVLFAYEPERSFWNERRHEQMRRSLTTRTKLFAQSPSLARFPIEPGGVVFPAAEKLPIRSAVAKSTSLPTGLDETYRSSLSSIPLAHSTIRKVSLPIGQKPRGLVFHIQDVHRNLDAQTNIAHVVTSLINGHSDHPTIALVGLEGAFRPYDLSWLRSFPDPPAARIAAEDLLAQDRMSGPMFSLLTSPHPIPPVIGIDDVSHYEANIAAYRRSLPTKETVQLRTKTQMNELNAEKTKAFNPELAAFDKRVRDYRQGTVSLGVYAHALDNKKGSPLAKPIELFLQALRMEETLDFKELETERAALLELLSRKMSQTQINDLIARSVAYRAGQVTYGDFYRWIVGLCQEAGVSLAQFPAMADYVRYVLLSDAIDAEALFTECQSRESELFTLLAKTQEERTLVARSHHLTLVGQLLDFALTPADWAEYERVRAENPPDPTLEPYEAFYREAHARDVAMAQNLMLSLEKMNSQADKKNPGPVSIIVTGGYHGPGLTKKLTESGMAVVSVLPKIQKVDTVQGSAYLSVFAQEKTPLNKLFEGAKLFVADSPLSSGNAALLVAAATAVSAQPNRPLSPRLSAFLQTHFKPVAIRWINRMVHVRLGFKNSTVGATYDASQLMGKKIRSEETPTKSLLSQWAHNLLNRPIDRQLLTTGSALVIGGVWLFFTGSGLVEKIGPFISMLGTMVIFHAGTTGTGGTSPAGGTAPVPSPTSRSTPVAQQTTMMASELTTGGGASPNERYETLMSIPSKMLDGKLVIVRTTPDRKGIKTVQSLVNAGARVVLLAAGKIENQFKEGFPNATYIKGEIRKEKHRWLSVADGMTIERTSPGSVVIFEDTSLDERYENADLSQRRAMAMELAGIEPNTLFVLDALVSQDSSTSALDEMANLLPGVFGPSISAGSVSIPLWGWDPHRTLTEGKIMDKNWKPLLHDPNNKNYAFKIDVNTGEYRAIPRRQVIDPTQDMSKQVVKFIKLQNEVNAGYGTIIQDDGTPKTENFVKIVENRNDPIVNYIVFRKNGIYDVYQGKVPDSVLNNPDFVLMVVQNTYRSTRPGAAVVRVSREEAENNPDMYKLTPNFIKTQMPMELYLEWESSDNTLYFFTVNPFPYFPNDKNRDPSDDVDHIVFSRGDGYVPQSEIYSLGFLTGAFEAMDSMNLSSEVEGQTPVHVGMNGWYYGKVKAGPSQIQAHAHFMRERFLVEHAPVVGISENSGVRIGHLGDPENGPALVLETGRENLAALIQKTHEALLLITAKGHSFNVLSFPVGDGYRVLIADKIGGVPQHWFENEFAFSESIGRAGIGDNVKKVRKFTEKQSDEFDKIDGKDKAAIVQWVKNNSKDLQVHPDLFQNFRKDILSVSVSDAEIVALAKQLAEKKYDTGPPTSGTPDGTPDEVNKNPQGQLNGMPILLAFLNFSAIDQAVNILDPSFFISVIAAVPWSLILGAIGIFVLVGIFEILILASLLWNRTKEEDEKEGIFSLLGSGIAHRVMAKILFVIARDTESEDVARIAVHHLVVPWRNLEFNANFQELRNRFKNNGWDVLAQEVDDIDLNGRAPSWLAHHAEIDVNQIGSVLVGRKSNLPIIHRDLLGFLKETFPEVGSLKIETLAPGLEHVRNVGVDLENKNYQEPFDESLRYFFRDEVNFLLGRSPTVSQMLARLMASAELLESSVPEGYGDKTPVHLEVCTPADLPVVEETLALVNAVNSKEEKKVHLLLAGVDADTVSALSRAVGKMENVTVIETPVGSEQTDSQLWNLNQSKLNDGFKTFQLNSGLSLRDIELTVSLSDGIAFTQADLIDDNSVDQALRDALRRFVLSLPLRPVDFKTMLKIISKARAAIEQSA